MISTFWEALAVLLGGVWAGTINTVVGSGTLVSFPTLVAVGLPPVTANVSNSIGLVPGSVTGAWGYRRELRGQGRRLRWLMPRHDARRGRSVPCSCSGCPSAAFEAMVPVLIGLGVSARRPRAPAAARWVAARHEARGGVPERGAWWVWPAVLGTGVYGGYFGAAQGVLLMAIFGIGIDDHVQRHNAIKNVLAALVNAVAAVVFIVVADVDWRAALSWWPGAILGGLIGASVGRRLSPTLLRAVIVVVGAGGAGLVRGVTRRSVGEAESPKAVEQRSARSGSPHRVDPRVRNAAVEPEQEGRRVDVVTVDQARDLGGVLLVHVESDACPVPRRRGGARSGTWACRRSTGRTRGCPRSARRRAWASAGSRRSR